MVIVNFIRDADVGIFARAKRLSKADRAAAPTSSAATSDAEETRK